MDTQSWIVIAFVALAAGFLLWKSSRSAAGKGCASGCGSCGSKDCRERKG